MKTKFQKYIPCGLCLLILPSFFHSCFAQLSGTVTVPGDYPTLTAAIEDLNLQGVGTGGVTISVIAENPQSAPAGGYIIGGAGSILLTTASMDRPVVIQGNSNIITAFTPQPTGNLNDAIFKIIGADWITITGFNMIENPANTNATPGTNDMTEWGIALLYSVTTDGAQNNTISANIIDLNRTYQNTFGIYSNSTHSATSVTTTSTATGLLGGNHNLQIVANQIRDINIGIIVIGPTNALDYNDGLIIGGAGNTNSITNFGTTGTFSSYAQVSPSGSNVAGILIRNTKNFEACFNTIESSVGGTVSGGLHGILVHEFSSFSPPAGVVINKMNNNDISLQSAAASGVIQGISIENWPGGDSTTVQINNNSFYGTGHTVAASGAITLISCKRSQLHVSISMNEFDDISVNTSGAFQFINCSGGVFQGGSKNVNGNAIIAGFSKTGGGGTSNAFIFDNGVDGDGSVCNMNNNVIRDIDLLTSSGFTAIYAGSGIGDISAVLTIMNNTIRNISGGGFTGISVDFNADGATVTGNAIDSISVTGGITGIRMVAPVTGPFSIHENIVHHLSSTASGAIRGITVTGAGVSPGSIFKNKVYDLAGGGVTSTVYGMEVISLGSGGVHFYNNLIGDLRAPLVSSTTVSIRGMSSTATSANSAISISYNTLWLNAASSGTNFSTAGVFHTASTTVTTATLILRNNIIVNTSIANGSGQISALRRSGTSLANYSTLSNNNIFYAGTPATPNYIYFDGSMGYQITAFKDFVGPIRESASTTENPPFISTQGASALFLHLDPAATSQAESGGISITGVIDDFDGNIRFGETGYEGTGSAPDIGADEFESSTCSSLVSSTADSGAGSLRDVIDCVVGGDTITFDAALSGQTIMITSGEIVIDKNLTIAGPGAMLLTISAGGLSRIFRVQNLNALTLTGITLSGGNEPAPLGGALLIESNAQVTLDNVDLADNTEDNVTPKALTLQQNATIIIRGSVMFIE